MQQNLFSAGTPPWTRLGELTTLTRWFVSFAELSCTNLFTDLHLTIILSSPASQAFAERIFFLSVADDCKMNHEPTLEPLQRVQNCAARLILNLRQWDHVTPAFQQLHWLPIQARVQFKLCTLMNGIHNSQCPAYLSDVVQSVVSTSTREGLRSAATTNYVTPRLQSKFGECAFSHPGPVAWNRLPEIIRQAQTQTRLKKLLKTFLFGEFL